MKLHVLAYNGHHQVSTMIKMSLYNLCEGVLMKRSLCINPLFVLVSSVNCLYISNKEVFPISSMEIGIFVLGCINSCGKAWLIIFILSLSLGGPLVSVILVDLVISCGGEEKTSV